MIQQGVSTDADPSREVTIGRIMDYIEARLEAIKTREEEEDEEEAEEERSELSISTSPRSTSATGMLAGACPRLSNTPRPRFCEDRCVS